MKCSSDGQGGLLLISRGGIIEGSDEREQGGLKRVREGGYPTPVFVAGDSKEVRKKWSVSVEYRGVEVSLEWQHIHKPLGSAL